METDTNFFHKFLNQIQSIQTEYREKIIKESFKMSNFIEKTEMKWCQKIEGKKQNQQWPNVGRVWTEGHSHGNNQQHKLVTFPTGHIQGDQ